MAVEDWSTTAGSNTSIDGTNIAENCPPGNINNAIRAIMANIATWRDGAIADLGDAADYQPLDASLTAFAALVTAANKGLYFTAADTPATYDLTAYGRTLAGLADAAALRTNIGAVTITAASLTSPGYVKINVSGTDLIFQWGTQSVGGNSTASPTYSQTFSTFAIPVGSGGPSSVSKEGDIRVTSSGLSGFSLTNSSDTTSTFYWIAVGV